MTNFKRKPNFVRFMQLGSMSDINSTATGLELAPKLRRRCSDIEYPKGHTNNEGFWEPPADYQDQTTGREEDQFSVQTDTSNGSNKYKSFSKLIVRFADKTSMQGVPYINSARIWYAKLIWTLLLVIAIGWMCFHLFYLISQFIQWPKQTKIKLSFSNLEMPAVTICNVNPIRTSALDRASQPLRELIKFSETMDNEDEDEDDDKQQTVPKSNGTETTSQSTNDTRGTGTGNVTNRPDTSVTGTGNVTNRPDTSVTGTDSNGNGTVRLKGGKKTGPPGTAGTSDAGPPPSSRKKRFVDNFDDYVDYDEDDFRKKNEPPRPPRDPIDNLEDTFRLLYFNEKRRTRVDMGHHIKDMLVGCSFDGYKCFPENFTLFQTVEYGNCFTIQSSEFTSKSPGPKHGLSIILFMENEEYISGLTQGYGARVTINDQFSFPYPDDEGFFISTGYETHIGIKQINIERLGYPYGACDDGIEFERRYGIKYSRQTCQNVCHKQTVIDQCGCFENVDVEMFSQSSVLDNLKSCKTREELKCQFETAKEFEDKTRTCDCENPCVEKQWMRSISTRQWPTKSYAKLLYARMCRKTPRRCTNLGSDDDFDISLNFLKFVVYYQDLNHEEIMEDPEIETAQFASDVGGAIGLWIGLSILSVFEVVQLFVELCQYGIYKCHHMGSVVRNDKLEFSSADRKPEMQAPGALNFNQSQFAKDHLYNGRLAKARYQY